MNLPLKLAIAMLALSATLSRAGDEPQAKKPESTTTYDLAYKKANDTELKLDMERPSEGDGPFPAVLVIHGGAWRAGSKDGNRPILHEFARRGYVAVSPQYRFCPKETFPAQVHDVKDAVRWMKSNAKEYKIDPERIGAMGFSAGGHLALMLGVTGPDDGLEGDAPKSGPDTKVRAVVNYFGPTDLAADDFPDVSKGLLKDFLGGTPTDKPEVAKKASPLTFVSKGDAPILSFQGTKDPLVPYTQATKLTTAQTQAEVPGRVDLLIGLGHGNDWGAELKRTQADTFAFFDKYLKPSGSK